MCHLETLGPLESAVTLVLLEDQEHTQAKLKGIGVMGMCLIGTAVRGR